MEGWPKPHTHQLLDRVDSKIWANQYLWTLQIFRIGWEQLFLEFGEKWRPSDLLIDSEGEEQALLLNYQLMIWEINFKLIYIGVLIIFQVEDY